MRTPYEGTYTVRHRTAARWVVALVGLAVIVFAIWAGADYGLDRSSARAIVGTSGRAPIPDGEDTSAGAPSDLVRLGAATNPHTRGLAEFIRGGDVRGMVGQRVELELDLAAHPSMVSGSRFWTDANGSMMLVVLNRDRRHEAERIEGESPEHGIGPLEPGHRYLVSGTIERLPRAEQMASWELSRGDVARLAGRPVYIRADAVLPIS